MLQTWDAQEKHKFHQKLTEWGWEEIEPEGKNRVYLRGNLRLLVDDYGLFIYVFSLDGDGWRRISGVSFDIIEEKWREWHLPFSVNYRMYYLNLRTGNITKKKPQEVWKKLIRRLYAEEKAGGEVELGPVAEV